MDNIEVMMKIENDMRYKPDTFTGTQAEWASVPTAQRAHYKIVNITDDLETEPVTLNISTDITRLYEEEVTITDGTEEIVRDLSSTGELTVQLHNIGTYTITCDIYERSINVSQLGITMAYEIGPEIVSWSEGTDAQIAKLIEAAYKDDVDLYDDAGWRIGDERVMSLSAMDATGVSESHRAQDVSMVIIDFNHDTLTTPINGKTKALITINQKSCLMAEGIDDTNGSSNSENGYMNSTNDTTTGWTNCARRTWCNSIYYNALSSGFKSLVKQVNKLTSAGNQSATINTTADYCFLPSEIEIFGSVTNSKAGEGSQYAWFASSASNKYKSPHWGTSFVSYIWWERSPRGSDATTFCAVYLDGSANYSLASNALSLAPAMCL